MIDFTYLFLTNFTSFKKADLPLSDQGLVLIEEGGSKGSIFVITHSEDLRSYFDTVTTVVKKDGVSRIES